LEQKLGERMRWGGTGGLRGSHRRFDTLERKAPGGHD